MFGTKELNPVHTWLVVVSSSRYYCTRNIFLANVAGRMENWFPRLKKSVSSPAQHSSNFTGDPTNNEYGKDYLVMPVEEKRKLYKCKDGYKTLKDIIPWPLYYKSLQSRGKLIKDPPKQKYDKSLINKVALYQGDITCLEIDAIVNAANESLLGGGGVDGCIHRGAGPSLRDECGTLKGCPTGRAKITGGHLLPAKYIIHTVGPVGEKPLLLKTCYLSCLDLLIKHKIRTIAFPCVSAGIYGYPSDKAAEIALDTVRYWLERNNADKVELIIFAVYTDKDIQAYEEGMQRYFPCEDQTDTEKREDDKSTIVESSPSDEAEKTTNDADGTPSNL